MHAAIFKCILPMEALHLLQSFNQCSFTHPFKIVSSSARAVDYDTEQILTVLKLKYTTR